MLGSTANAIAIVICGLVGCFLVRGVPSRVDDIIRKAIGLSLIFIGIKGALDNQRTLLLAVSLIIGAVIGELIGIDALMNRLGLWAEKRLGMSGSGEKHSFSRGFVTASILFCSGSMAIVGSIQSGLAGNNELLFTKAILDGVISIIFGASMGIGVVFSAIPVFLYESGIVLGSMVLKSFLTADIIREMSAVGSLIIAAIGLNFLGIKEIKVANLVPAVFIPLIYITIENLIKS